MTAPDVGLSHVALPVTDLDRSLEFYRRFANLEVIHRRDPEPGHGVWAHIGVGCLSREEVDHRLALAATEGHAIIGPCDDGPPTGYWGIIVDPDGHNLELSFGQQVSASVASALG